LKKREIYELIFTEIISNYKNYANN